MSSELEERLEVIEKIEMAFVDTADLPPESILRDGAIFDEEARYIKNKLNSKNWRDICNEPRIHHGDDLAFLSSESLIYFLPGYMILSTKYFEEADILVDNLVDMLTPSKLPDETWSRGLLEKSKDFSEEKANAIVSFLKYIKSKWSVLFKHDIDPAIQYWASLK